MGTRTQRAAEREAAPRGAPAGQRGRGRWLRPLALAAALACAVIAVHWPALGAQGLALDDDAFVVRNPLVQRPGWESTRRFFVEVTHPSTVSAYYLPLSMTSLMVDWAAGGRPGNLAVFHVTSLLLHVAATLLVFLVLRSLFGSDVPAALAALLYGVHPLMVEPIASAGERKTVLATALALASLHAHLRWATGGLRRWWLASIAWFLLALLAKPSVVTLPLAMLVLDVWPLRRGWRTAALEKWPHVLLAAVAAFVSVLAVRNTWEFAAPPPLDPLRYVTQVVWLQGFYLGKLLWPVGLSTVYDSPARFSIAAPGTVAPMAAAVALALAAWRLRRRAPGLLAGGIVFFVLLAPTFSILRYGSVIAYDRYLHLPALGFTVTTAALLAALGPWQGSAAPSRRIGAAVAMLALAAAAALAARAAWRPWRDTLGVWQQAVRVSPGVPDAWNGLGATYSAAGRAPDAIAAFQRANAVGPNYADSRYNLGRELVLQGRAREAVPYLAFAVSHTPGSADAVLELGVALERAGRPKDAEACYRRALALKPGSVATLIRLGDLETLQGRLGEGEAQLRRALAVAPGDPVASLALARALAIRTGTSPEVVGLLRQAIAARPGWADPLNELAWLLATDPDPAVRDPAEALSLSDRALAAAPADANVLDTRAAALAASGRYDEAAATAERALAMARTAHDDSLAGDIAERVARFRHGRAFVQDPRGVR